MDFKCCFDFAYTKRGNGKGIPISLAPYRGASPCGAVLLPKDSLCTGGSMSNTCRSMHLYRSYKATEQRWKSKGEVGTDMEKAQAGSRREALVQQKQEALWAGGEPSGNPPLCLDCQHLLCQPSCMPSQHSVGQSGSKLRVQ